MLVSRPDVCAITWKTRLVATRRAGEIVANGSDVSDVDLKTGW